VKKAILLGYLKTFGTLLPDSKSDPVEIPAAKFGRQFTNPQTDFRDCWTLKMGALCFSGTG
jgi:hypothetical protein